MYYDFKKLSDEDLMQASIKTAERINFMALMGKPYDSLLQYQQAIMVEQQERTATKLDKTRQKVYNQPETGTVFISDRKDQDNDKK